MSNPVVGIYMGSDSDLPVMQEAAKVLEDMGVEYELTILSAHRTPERMMEHGAKAAERGIKVIIAGAGRAAHLPGMLASVTPLPVIGVPITGSDKLASMDSLFSIVQMPPGIPVATVALDGAKNAGLLAVRILGVDDLELRAKTEAFALRMKDEVVAKAEKLESLGYKAYLEAKGK